MDPDSDSDVKNYGGLPLAKSGCGVSRLVGEIRAKRTEESKTKAAFTRTRVVLRTRVADRSCRPCSSGPQDLLPSSDEV